MLLVIGSFGAGFFWQSAIPRAKAALAEGNDLPADPAARAQALDHIDEAIAARSEDRFSGALNALVRARSADPRVPSLDMLFAMLALKQGDAESARLAARNAIKNNLNLADANVMLGVERWRARGAGSLETRTAADEASIFFSEAIQADLYDSGAYLYWAEAVRGSGQETKGRLLTLGALHRMNPWQSALLLSAKSALASAEVDENFTAAVSILPAQDAGLAQTVLALRRAIVEGGDQRSAASALRNRITAAQAMLLASDPGLAGARTLLLQDSHAANTVW